MDAKYGDLQLMEQERSIACTMGAFVVPVKGLIYSIYQDLGAEKGCLGFPNRSSAEMSL